MTSDDFDSKGRKFKTPLVGKKRDKARPDPSQASAFDG